MASRKRHNVAEKVLVYTSDDTIYVMDDYGGVHVYEVEPDGSLTEVLAPGRGS
jgi:hypothetical protein